MIKFDFESYHIEGLTDLQKIRDQAQRHAKGDFYAKPKATCIHFHRRNVLDSTDGVVLIECVDFKHEIYHSGGEIEVVTPSPPMKETTL